MKKIIVEFEKNIKLVEFDNKINKLVETFPKEISVIINVDISNDKPIATISINPDKNALERKVWEIKNV